jgi:expansin
MLPRDRVYAWGMRRHTVIAYTSLVASLTTCAALGAPLHRGEGTFYAAGPLGACGRPQPTLHTAVSPADFSGSSLCGAYLEVSRAGKAPIVVEVTNLCPECPPGNLDLSPSAYDRLGARVAGRIPISWRIVGGPVSGPISIQIKDGSNPYWVAIQVRNHRYPIKSVEAKRGARWLRLSRTDYGYFLAPNGLGPGPFSLRISDTRGHGIVEAGVGLAPGTAVAGRSQFPR